MLGEMKNLENLTLDCYVEDLAPLIFDLLNSVTSHLTTLTLISNGYFPDSMVALLITIRKWAETQTRLKRIIFEGVRRGKHGEQWKSLEKFRGRDEKEWD